MIDKVWRKTEPIVTNRHMSVYSLEALKGDYSSQHRHLHIDNIIHVISGALIIRTWDINEVMRETLLTSGMQATIFSGTWHSFAVVEDVVAVEVYEGVVRSNDIVRRTAGGPGSPTSAIPDPVYQ